MQKTLAAQMAGTFAFGILTLAATMAGAVWLNSALAFKLALVASAVAYITQALSTMEEAMTDAEMPHNNLTFISMIGWAFAVLLGGAAIGVLIVA